MIGVVLISAIAGVLAALWIARPFAAGAEPRTRLIGLGAAALVALGALAAYAVNGEPDAPGQPYAVLAERLASADPSTLTVQEQEERLRGMLRANPRDAQASAILGRFLARTGRELEAIALFERSLSAQQDPRVLSDLGQALVTLNEGRVTPEAARAFASADALAPELPEPAFFLGVAAYEAGDRKTAADRWAGILARLEPGDPFRREIAARAADLLSRPQGGPGADGAAPFAEAARQGADMSQIIDSMVGGVQARLDEDPDDLSGWLTVARARMMQERPEEAGAALARARTQFAGEPGKLAMIEAIGQAMGLNEENET
ncbi:MAG: hypothetical protein ABL308_15125 [Oceanicaulis sp.]